MKHYAHNPRKISSKQLQQLTGWLEEYGDLSGIVHNIRTDEIIGGNQRSDAMHLLNGGKVKPVIEHKFRKPTKQGTVATGYFEYKGERFQYRQVSWTPKKAAGANIIANKAGGTWDGDKLLEFFPADDLLEFGFDQKELEGFGFEFEDETKDAEPQIDRAAELLKKWKVRTGDMFAIGEHKLICGDCTDTAVVARVMDGSKADVVFTSPPYNGNTTMYDYIIVDGKKKRKDKTLYADNETDNKTSEEYIEFCHTVLGLCFENTKGFIFWNINYNANSRHEYIDSIYPFREKLQETIVWKKQAIPTANGFTRNFEFIFMFKTDEDLGHLNKEYDVIHTFWEVSNAGSQSENHKACFPVELPQKAIAISDRVKLVYEPFSGSGTTLVACENLHRRCRAVEISPAYVAVALERMATAFPDLKIEKVKS